MSRSSRRPQFLRVHERGSQETGPRSNQASTATHALRSAFGPPVSLPLTYREQVRYALAALILLAMSVGSAEAQLFGRPRQLGSPLSRSARAGVAEAPPGGTIQTNSRFLRGNRGRGEFVGTDAGDRRTFVGSQQGRTGGPVLSAVAGLRPETDRSSRINRTLRDAKRNQPYPPRIELGFTVPADPGLTFPRLLRRELENPRYFSSTNRFSVSVEGRTAILRGVVADAKERDLAALLVSFEPGISQVKNELRVVPSMDRDASSSESQEVPPPIPMPRTSPIRPPSES